MSHSDRSRSLCTFSYRPSKFSLLAWTYGISCPGLTCDVQSSDHSQVVGSFVGILSNVSASDACQTSASFKLDSATSFSHQLHPCFVRQPSLLRPSRHQAFRLLSHRIAVQPNHVHLLHLTASAPPVLPRDLRRAQLWALSRRPMPRIYGFDLNEHWQSDKDYYDNQKINGLTLSRTIRSSAFTQKLDIEGCDPLSLPLAALLYQQANNNWIRKLASGREMYLIPIHRVTGIYDGTSQAVPNQRYRP